jgi:hypothetical protein
MFFFINKSYRMRIQYRLGFQFLPVENLVSQTHYILKYFMFIVDKICKISGKID